MSEISEDGIEFTPIDQRMKNLLDTLESNLAGLELTSTPQYIFARTVSEFIRDHDFERLPSRIPGDTKTKPFPNSAKALYQNAVYGMTVKFTNVDCNDENSRRKVEYYGKRYGRIACLVIQRFTEKGVDENAIAALLSDMSFTYEA